MRPGDTRVLGKSGLAVTQLGLGGAPLGNMYRAFSDAQAEATVRASYDAGLRLFDTAPLYGFGLSEHRIGAALRDKPRDSFVLSTKVGRLLRPGHPSTLDHGQFEGSLPFAEVYDYSYDGVMRSVEHSLHRIGTYRIDILLVHDLDVWTHGSEDARVEKVQAFMAGGYRAMLKLREEGTVKAIGAGSTRPRHARTWRSGATSTAFCSPAATPCSSRHRSRRSCRCASGARSLC
jgi:D-threo-aldose 1-dehydrogenase